MYRLPTVLALCVLPVLAHAGKKDKLAEHANHYKPVAPMGQDVKIGVKDAWARDYEAKMKVTVVNDTADYVLYKPVESVLVVDGNEYGFDRGRDLVVGPKSQGSRVLGLKGGGLHALSMELRPGGVYLVPKNAPVVAAPDFRLPLENSNFEAGNFSCGIPKKIKQETDETHVKFDCQYTGDALGIVDSRAIQVRLEDGQLFASEHRSNGPQVYQPGQKFKLEASFHVSAKVVDMQFATMYLVFNDTFREGQPRLLQTDPVLLEFDVAMTDEKN